MSSPEPERFIGRPFDRKSIKELLSLPEEEAEVDEFAGKEIFGYLKNGLDVYLGEDGAIETLFLYGPGNQDHGRYQGSLPGELSFESTEADVVNRFGQPSRRGVMDNTKSPWVRYEMPRYAMHVQFSNKTSCIEQITLMRSTKGDEPA